MNGPRGTAVVLDWLPYVNRSTDPLDDCLLALCEAGQADFLATGDKAGLLAPGTHGGTTILTARVFLDHLAKSRQAPKNLSPPVEIPSPHPS